jgi:hypothetical protein
MYLFLQSKKYFAKIVLNCSFEIIGLNSGTWGLPLIMAAILSFIVPKGR